MKKLFTVALVFVTLLAFSQRNNTISVERYYTIKKGNVWFHATRLMYGFQDGIIYPQTETDTIYFYNDLDKPLECSFENLPAFITTELIPEVVPPKGEGKVAVTYDTKIKDAYGPTFDYFFMQTNDVKQKKKRLIVSPDIKEDFSGLTPEELENAPVISYDHDEYDFGTITMGDKIHHTFSFTNEGGRDLIIRRTKASCGCTSPTPEKKVIKPGETGTIDVQFNSLGKKNEQHHLVTVITNDPKNPETSLEISGMVKKK